MKKKLVELTIGERLPVSNWISIGQSDINLFANATGDDQWIHVDTARCTKESPFGTTIAHGYYAVTLIPQALYDSVFADPEYPTLLNYGVDKVRFVEPVRVNDKVRFHSTLVDIEQKSTGRLFYFETTVEIENQEKPALKGIFLTLLVGAK
ncbi:MaoC family dehydratase [Paraglaciecola sp.]|uniref:MaoC family dehydratase n=1 Tax=Paraglaciecola sp. TaxID=1920173 RepID=UPI003266E1AE